jgi:hypothetical protein
MDRIIAMSAKTMASPNGKNFMERFPGGIMYRGQFLTAGKSFRRVNGRLGRRCGYDGDIVVQLEQPMTDDDTMDVLTGIGVLLALAGTCGNRN